MYRKNQIYFRMQFPKIKKLQKYFVDPFNVVAE